MIHVFDAYGTLLDVTAAVRRVRARIGDATDGVAALMRAKQLEYSWVRTLGQFPWRDFRVLTADALDYALAAHRIDADEGLRREIIALYDRLDPFPEVPATLQRQASGGARLAVLSNGSQDMLDTAFGASGLAPLFEALISVDTLRRFKPLPDVYALACERLGASASEIAFYSSNRWDAAAAARFGFQVTWVNRVGAPDEYRDYPPKRVVRSLDEID
jgi:2-haloacid dehalogenase